MTFNYDTDLTSVVTVYVVVAIACLTIILFTDLLLTIFKRFKGGE